MNALVEMKIADIDNMRYVALNVKVPKCENNSWLL